MKFEKRKQNGYTLVEMLVSIAIFVMIGLAVANFGQKIFFYNDSVQNNLGAELDARLILRNLIAELRSASPSSLGAYPIEQAGTSTLIFYSNVNSDAYQERLRYFLSGKNLMRGVTKPSGNPLVYNTAQETLSTVVHNVVNGTNTPIFDYFDENYYGTTSPLAQPVNTLSVRLVRVTVLINANPNQFPTPIKVTSQGTLRNLKDNL